MLKTGVDLRGMHPVWGIAFPLIMKIFNDAGYNCVITSANDSKHGVNSLHYKGAALDLRSKHVRVNDKHKILQDMRAALGTQFDCLLESAGGNNEHYHVEFDPKEVERSEDV